MNWFSQIATVTLFSLRTIPQRLGSVLACAVGIAGVVAVFCGVLSISEGFKAAMSVKGSEDVALVLRAGADNEMTSGLSREEARLVGEAAGIARTEDGPITSAELFVIINLTNKSTGTDANVPFRGVERAAPLVRGDFKIIDGRMFEPGKNEIVAGRGAARTFVDLEVNRTLRIGQAQWQVVGIFSGGGGSAETEIWTDAAVLQQAYQRGDSFQSVYAKLVSPEALKDFKKWLAENPRLKVRALPQAEFLAEQSSMLTGFIQNFGVFIAAMMALGALFGALNTMYSAIADRTREIATLRALGFGSSPIIISVLLESLLLALIGGAVGATASYLAFDGFKAATMNWQTFSQVAFAFSVTPVLLGKAILWAAGIGLVGGLFPAIRAARLPIAAALRET